VSRRNEKTPALDSQAKPAACWFCKQRVEAQFIYRRSLWRVICGYCQAEGPTRHSKAEAIHAWNGATARNLGEVAA